MTAENADVSGLRDKTPISYLQELCNKRGITPQYDLVANEGAVHEPLFVFRVTAGEYSGIGRGTSKKKAKHNAAIGILSQMTGLPSNLVSNSSTDATNGESFGTTECKEDARNPIGELQEMTQKRMWPPPAYDFTNEIGPAHAREFVCTVKLFNVVEHAVGKSKKLAKRNAALAMLNTVQQGGIEPVVRNVEHEEMQDDDTIPLTNAHATFETSQRNNDGEYTRARKKISPMFQMTKKSKLGPVLENLQNTAVEELKSVDGIRRLEELASEQKFAVKFTDMPLMSLSNSYQCVVELSTNPLIVCYGSSSESADDAHLMAAVNALIHCRIMTQRTLT